MCSHSLITSHLYKAAEEGESSIVDALLDQKVDVNAKDDNGSTPLCAACGGEGNEQALLCL